MRSFKRLLVVVLAGGAAILAGCGSRYSAGGDDDGSSPDGTTTGDAAAVDSGLADAAVTDSGSVDSGVVDAGNLCGPNDVGDCEETGLDCLCCPAGGPLNNCLCTTYCHSDGDCTDPARPHCNQPHPNSQGICTAVSFGCAWGAVCAAPDTPIATPTGPRAIASLRVGELVYSVHEGSMLAVPLRRVSRTAVHHHWVRRIQLSGGAVLQISAGHPTADGRPLADLVVGRWLGEQRVTGITDVPYRFPYTYDILPASDTGTYVAGGALIGSTLE